MQKRNSVCRETLRLLPLAQKHSLAGELKPGSSREGPVAAFSLAAGFFYTAAHLVCLFSATAGAHR